FIGAYVGIRGLPASALDEAEIALAGPLAGGLSALTCVVLYNLTQLRLFLPLAYLAFLLNLLNLLPVPPLDGGRIVGAISRWFWPVVLVGVAGYAIAVGSGLLLILIAFAIFQVVQSMGRSWRSSDRYYRISWLARVYVTLIYLGLAVVLTLGMLA